jgi:glutathione synthase/RimK-type ligase-like ATP-grasp enzyme
VLIVSTKADTATDEVVKRLAARSIDHYRLNTEDYPFSHAMTYSPTEPDAWLHCDGQPVPSPTSIWYRRVRTAPTPEGMEEGVAAFCRQEARAAIIGSIVGQAARWMSHPAAVWQAEFKPYQLHLAAALGLRIPRTVITNSPERVRAAFRDFGSMIIKPARTGYVQTSSGEYAIYTSRVLEQHLDEVDSARWSPAIYQELIPKAYDVRVTIVGTRCFAALIDSQSDPAAVTDWRQTNNPALPHQTVTLPECIVRKLHDLMGALRLTFGAVDLIQTSSGEYVFLEVNPSGQWLWLDDMLTFGISDTVAGWLASCDD